MISVPYHSHIFRDSYGNSAFLRYTSKVSGVDPSKVFLPNTSLRKMLEFGIYPTPKKNKIDTQNGHSLNRRYIFQTIHVADHLWYRAPTSLSSLSALMASNVSNASQVLEKTLVPKRIWTYPTFIYIYICIYIYTHTHPGKLKKQKNNIEQMPGRFLKLQLLPKENHSFRF